MTVSVRGVTRDGLVYQRRGRGRPIILLHGWCLSRRMWLYLEETLIDRFEVITPDQRGFGESSAMPGPYTLDLYAADLAQLHEELALRETTVVGFAFGAAVAMALAAQGDGQLGRLVLIGVPSAATAAYDKMPRAMRRDWPLFAERSATAICVQPLSPASQAWLAGIFAGTSLPVAIETCALLGVFEPTSIAAAVQIPALLVHGERDEIVPVAVSEACAALMPKARLERVPDSGHLVVMDQKQALAELVARFAMEKA